MLIEAYREGESTWQLYCPICRSPTDLVETDVLVSLLLNQQSGLCIDCLGQADYIPDCLDPSKPGGIDIKCLPPGAKPIEVLLW